MNYKILAASTVATLGLLTFGIMQSGISGEDYAVVERVTSYDVAEPVYESVAEAYPAPPAAMVDTADLSATKDIAELKPGATIAAGGNGPKIAYRFGFGFRVPAEQVKALQDRHADLCEAKGANVCRIISMEQVEDEEAVSVGNLVLAVAAPLARNFGKDLTRSAEGAQGELISSSIDGEDLSKAIVDTEARLRARIVLRDRLMDVLQNRRGTVAELVEAERGVAQVNEEIDKARSWLTEMNGRVDFSQLNIDYSTGAAPVSGFAEPIVSAFTSAGATTGTILGAIIRLLTVLVPFLVIGWFAVMAWRLAGRPGSARLRKIDEPEPA